MSTEQNKAIVRAFVEAINRQDWQRFEELVAPDFVRPGVWTFSDVLLGP
jgi:ketosteroid isomerase-like protein